MGRYISNKILKYNKKSSNTYRSRPSQSPMVHMSRPRKTKDSTHSDTKPCTHRSRPKCESPPVGYYKLNYDIV